MSEKRYGTVVLLWVLLCTLVCQNGFAGPGDKPKKDLFQEDEKSSAASEAKAEDTSATSTQESQVENLKPNSKECEQLADILVGQNGPASIVQKHLKPNENEYFRATCKRMRRVMHKSPQVEAQDRIRKMVGELKRVEPGSFLMGSPEGEPADGDDQKPRHVVIKEGYWLPVDDITVANYHYVMTGQWIEGGDENAKLQEVLKKEYSQRNQKKNGKNEKEEKNEKHHRNSGDGGELQYPDPEFLMKNAKKPMRGLTGAQWDEFMKKLNEQIAKEWPIAYAKQYRDDGNKVPVFDRPEDYELEFATTIPLEQEEEVDNPAYKANKAAPAKVKITAKHTVFPGVNQSVKFHDAGRLDGADYEAVKNHIVCQKPWKDGPSDVDAVRPNERGFRNLTGNIWKQTKTQYEAGSVRRVLVGGGWGSIAGHTRSASRLDWSPDDPNPYVGLRPIARVHTPASTQH